MSGRKNISPLYRECGGWLARYGIWDITADEPQLQQEYQISLDREEVWLQVQHFLIRSHPYAPEAAASTPTSRHKLHFPTAIRKSDLTTFAILRTVYTLSRHDPTPVPNYESHILPLDFNESLRSVWVSKLSWDLAERSPIKYTYGIEFSGCGRFALYDDMMGMTMLPKKKTISWVATTLAVFSFPGSDANPGQYTETWQAVCLIGNIAGSTQGSYFTEWSFHPTLPVLAVQGYDFNQRISQTLMLWNFASGESPSGSPCNSWNNNDFIPSPSSYKLI